MLQPTLLTFANKKFFIFSACPVIPWLLMNYSTNPVLYRSDPGIVLISSTTGHESDAFSIRRWSRGKFCIPALQSTYIVWCLVDCFRFFLELRKD